MNGNKYFNEFIKKELYCQIINKNHPMFQKCVFQVLLTDTKDWKDRNNFVIITQFTGVNDKELIRKVMNDKEWDISWMNKINFQWIDP